MSEHNELDKWVADYLEQHGTIMPEISGFYLRTGWQACAERKDKEIAALTQLIHEMSGAIWRLREYHYLVEQEPPDSDDQAQMDHWLDILDYCISKSRIIVKRANETGQPTALLTWGSE